MAGSPGAGPRDRRIDVLRAQTTVDAFNTPVETWSVLVSRWAGYTPVLDGERERAGETIGSLKARFVVRRDAVIATVTPRDRLQMGALVFDVNGVKDLGRNRDIEITATARTDLT